jgi:cell division protein FtsW
MVRTNPNRWERIIAFMDLESYKQGRGWQQWLATQAFGNGGTSGMGLGMVW